MIRRTTGSLLFAAVIIACLISFPQTTIAGPPLLCHPMEIGGARSLPWSGTAWRAVQADYDASRLVADTVSLIGPDVPVIVRMETLRRATIYSMWSRIDREVGFNIKDAKIADELLARLKEREQAAHGKGGTGEGLALFDLGYLAETYKQASSNAQNPAHGIDGYAMVVEALRLRGSDPEMEFAAALITAGSRGDTHPEHLKKAIAGAKGNSLLAQNIASHFGQNTSHFGQNTLNTPPRNSILPKPALTSTLISFPIIGVGLAAAAIKLRLRSQKTK